MDPLLKLVVALVVCRRRRHATRRAPTQESHRGARPAGCGPFGLGDAAAGRALLCAIDGAMLGHVMMSLLEPNDDSLRSGVRSFSVACAILLRRSHWPKIKIRIDDYPHHRIRPPVAMLAAAVAKEDCCCRGQIRATLDDLQSSLQLSASQPLRELGQALGTPDPVAALHAMAADFTPSPQELPTAPSVSAQVASTLLVSTLWPKEWHHEEKSVSVIHSAVESSLFGKGLVSTDLDYNWLALARRQTSADEMDDVRTDGVLPPSSTAAASGRVIQMRRLPRGQGQTPHDLHQSMRTTTVSFWARQEASNAFSSRRVPLHSMWMTISQLL